MPSLFRAMPGLEEEVMERVPMEAAPYTMLTEATSDSPWTKNAAHLGHTAGKILRNFVLRGDGIAGEEPAARPHGRSAMASQPS